MAGISESESCLWHILEELQNSSENEDADDISYHIENEWGILQEFEHPSLKGLQHKSKSSKETVVESKPNYFHFCGLDENSDHCTTWFVNKTVHKSTNQAGKDRDTPKRRKYRRKIRVESGSQSDSIDTPQQIMLSDVAPVEPAEKTPSIQLDYHRGSLVWAKVPGYSMWPAMVDDDPDYNTFYWVYPTTPPVQYHVVFFDEKQRLSRFWCSPDQLKSFAEPLKNPPSLKSASLMKRFDISVQEASKASTMSIENRLKRFGFKKRFSSPGTKLCDD